MVSSLINNIGVKKILITLILLLKFSQSTCQNKISLSGTIKDSTQVLSSANIIAYPKTNNGKMSFSISNAVGKYKLNLISGVTYEINISYLGYEPLKFTLTPEVNTQKSFLLKPQSKLLNEVTLNYKIPIIVKKDTIIYNTESFTDGKERKLRDVLKKLPGVEVDKAGNVTVNGKKITNLLVENDTFFNGDSKLAVNNIPADAVDKIEVIDDYNEIELLKGLQESSKLAMNIKLKKNKREFIFGDLSQGGGFNNRYIVNPSLFYYSPNSSVNFIGDINNTNSKSFTVEDYINFEGGLNSMLDDIGSYLKLANDDFSRFLSNQDFFNNKNAFSAINFNKKINNNLKLRTYVIYSKSEIDNKSSITNYYNSFNEKIINKSKSNENFLLSKISIEKKKVGNSDLRVTSFFKASRNNSIGNSKINSNFQNTQLDKQNNLNAFSLKNIINFTKKTKSRNTYSFLGETHFNRNNTTNNFDSNKIILPDLVKLIPDSIQKIVSIKELNSNNYNFIFKYYFILNNTNNIYFSSGLNHQYSRFVSNDIQLLSNGSVNDFSNFGFDNDAKHTYKNYYFKLQHKYKMNKLTIESSILLERILWKISQSDSSSKDDVFILPKIKIKYEFGETENLSFKYYYSLNFPTILELYKNYSVVDFNSIYRGNSNLNYEPYQNFLIYYYNFNIFQDFFITASANFAFKSGSIKKSNKFDNTSLIQSLIYINDTEKRFNLNLKINKKIGNFKLGLESTYNFFNFYQILNDIRTNNKVQKLNTKFNVKSYFDKLPNFDISYTRNSDRYKSIQKISFYRDAFDFQFEYDFLDSFSTSIGYNYSRYTNLVNINNTFDNLNLEFTYQKTSSPWSIIFKAENILNNQFIQSNSVSDILVVDQKFCFS